MIKRTLCFSHPAYLSLRNGQLVVKLEKHDDEPEKQATIPIEDIGVVVLDHRQITLTHGVMAALLDNNAAVKCRRVKTALPAFGQVGYLTITDKQFSEIELFVAKKEVEPNAPGQQLELF